MYQFRFCILYTSRCGLETGFILSFFTAVLIEMAFIFTLAIFTAIHCSFLFIATIFAVMTFHFATGSHSFLLTAGLIAMAFVFTFAVFTEVSGFIICFFIILSASREFICTLYTSRWV